MQIRVPPAPRLASHGLPPQSSPERPPHRIPGKSRPIHTQITSHRLLQGCRAGPLPSPPSSSHAGPLFLFSDQRVCIPTSEPLQSKGPHKPDHQSGLSSNLGELATRSKVGGLSSDTHCASPTLFYVPFWGPRGTPHPSMLPCFMSLPLAPTGQVPHVWRPRLRCSPPQAVPAPCMAAECLMCRKRSVSVDTDQRVSWWAVGFALPRGPQGTRVLPSGN